VAVVSQPEGSACAVLVVDDNPRNLVAMEAMLASLPVSIVSVQSAREALAQLLARDFTLVLLDVRMPEVKQAYSLGAVDFMFKPLVPEMVRAKVSAFIAARIVGRTGDPTVA
jgi:response regulator RpfG family c-di-GMP phosphodiesterase